jgi:ATP dependent DNA ligase domain
MHWQNPGPVRRPPGFIEPCLPTNSHVVPTGPQWAYEIKHDGFRFVCRRELDRVRVFSRRGHDWTDRVPRIADALTALRVTSTTLDGEGVVCGPDGVADFDRLRAAVGRKGSITGGSLITLPGGRRERRVFYSFAKNGEAAQWWIFRKARHNFLRSNIRETAFQQFSLMELST